LGNRTSTIKKEVNKMKMKLKSGVRGITGLETAIILIAFVVVAAVFAYTVLSAGIFSTQKSQETVYSGLEEASGSMQIKSGVIAEDAGADLDVDTVKFVVSNSAAGGAIDLTAPIDTTPADGIPDTNSTHKMIVSYLDEGQRFVDVDWSKTELGYGDGDDLLEAGEQMEISVDLTAVDTGGSPLVKDTEFTLELKPAEGGSLVITRLTPHKIDTINDLH
jgi:flagellin FlaB